MRSRKHYILPCLTLTISCSEGSSASEGTSSFGSNNSDPGSATEFDEDGSSTGTTNDGADPSGTTSAGATGGEPTTAGTDGATTSDTTGTTGAEVLTSEALAGRYASAECEAHPDGMGGTSYLTRDFTLSAEEWQLDLTIYMDAACATKLFSMAIVGPYTLGGAAAVAGATEGEFGITTNVWTAHQTFMADTFTMAGCGAEAWVVEVPQDVTATGCIGVAHPIAECPEEYDIVALDGDALYFGERVTDMCEPEGRPAALGAYPVLRM